MTQANFKISKQIWHFEHHFNQNLAHLKNPLEFFWSPHFLFKSIYGQSAATRSAFIAKFKRCFCAVAVLRGEAVFNQGYYIRDVPKNSVLSLHKILCCLVILHLEGSDCSTLIHVYSPLPWSAMVRENDGPNLWPRLTHINTNSGSEISQTTITTYLTVTVLQYPFNCSLHTLANCLSLTVFLIPFFFVV